MNAKKGFKKYGKVAVSAVIKEFRQLVHGAFPGKKVVDGVDPKTLTEEEKQQALDAVNLIKEKRTGEIKGRTCANGSKQHLYLKENESVASPTVSLEGLITSLIIDAYEGRDVSSFDVPGAYLHVKMPSENGKQILLKIKGEFVDLMCEVNPDFEKYVIYENGVKVLYLIILRALYGCIQSALLWYNLYSSTLVEEGFTINQYDKCVANKMINGKQCTIAFYVDDNKVSHEDPEVVSKVIQTLKGHFGDLKVVRGTKHTFLGMNIEILKDKKIQIDMREQLQEAIDMFLESTLMKASSPGSRYVFQVDDDAEQLNKHQSEIFHSTVAKLLFIAKRARPDIIQRSHFYVQGLQKVMCMIGKSCLDYCLTSKVQSMTKELLEHHQYVIYSHGSMLRTQYTRI